MTTSERVAAYRADTASKKPLGKFNFKAFIFNSFYFLYYDLPWYFLLFAILPLLIMLPFLAMDMGAVALLVGLIISRIIAALTASKIVYRGKVRYAEKFANADSNATIEYFSVSLWRLAIFSFLSGGLYAFYWAYKNWQAIQKATKDDVSPILWGWVLWLFCIIQLFRRFNASMQKHKLSAKSVMPYGYGIVTMAIIQAALASDAWEQTLSDFAWIMYILSAFAYLIGIGLLVAIQKQINLYNKKINPQQEVRKKLLLGEVITTIVGVVLFVNAFMAGGVSVDIQVNPELEQKLGRLSEQEQNAVGFIGSLFVDKLSQVA